MYVKLWDVYEDDTKYTEISELSFSPQTDIISQSLPINEFSVTIRTDDEFFCGMTVALYDDLDNVWARRYWITSVDRLEPGVVRLKAQSMISQLEGVTMPPVMYDEEPLLDVLDTIFAVFAAETPRGQYVVSPEFEELTLSGFCPEQSARDRLLWICFVIRAFVRTYFYEKIEILTLDTDVIPVPIRETYMRPTVTQGDVVTEVRLAEYAFSLVPEGEEPGQDVETVTDGVSTWAVTETVLSMENASAPMTAAENVKEVTRCLLVNSGNSAEILAHMALYYFSGIEISADLINNGAYKPGKRLQICTDAETGTMYTGYVSECGFRFGVQAMSTVKLVAAEKAAPQEEPEEQGES